MTTAQFSTNTEPVRFKFRVRDQRGALQGFLASKGTVTDEGLTLGKERIAGQSLLGADSRSDFVVIRFRSHGAIIDRVIRVYRVKPQSVVAAVNRLVAMNAIAARAVSLHAQGRDHEMVVRPCPACSTPLDLTDFPHTPATHCQWCQTLFESRATHGRQETRVWTGMRLCDQCGLFSTPRQFTTFYFWFLLVVYGFSYRQAHMCHACMRKEAWKMLGANLIFILGVPTAVTQLIRSYSMDSAFNPDFKGLDTANGQTASFNQQAARKAVTAYEEIERRVGCAPGVRYNHALALQRAGDQEAAIAQLELCLAECSNYAPAFLRLVEMYRLTKQDVKRDALVRAWNPQEREFARDADVAQP